MNRKFRKVAVSLHLWLGLLSGIVVVVVCLTGCLYVFKDEINDLTQPWRFVAPRSTIPILPSQAIRIADFEVEEDRKATALTYGESGDALSVDYFSFDKGITTVYMNPYDGEVKKTITKQKGDFDFFRFVLNGHRSLWMPAAIGKPIVGYSVLLFLITLITGIILWWPSKWTVKATKRNLRVKWKKGFARLNFDLHKVLGGYAALILIILSFTGLIFGLGWFSESVYFLTSGGKKLQPYTLPKSDTLQVTDHLSESLDRLYVRLQKAEPEAKTFYFALPAQVDDVIRVSVVHKRNSYYQTDNLFFDQYTLKSLEGVGPYAGKYKEVSGANQFRRMNLEIHDGRIGGIFGKVLAFLASLIGASLPVTGFIIWFRKKRKRTAVH